jgi:hypothetical protein
MKLFQSKYRIRIEKRLAELVIKRNNLTFELSGIKQSLNPAEYAKRSVAISDLNMIIEELKELVK